MEFSSEITHTLKIPRNIVPGRHMRLLEITELVLLKIGSLVISAKPRSFPLERWKVSLGQMSCLVTVDLAGSAKHYSLTARSNNSLRKHLFIMFG